MIWDKFLKVPIFPVSPMVTSNLPKPVSPHLKIISAGILLKCSHTTTTASMCPRLAEVKRPAPVSVPAPARPRPKIVLEVPAPPSPLPERVKPSPTLPDLPKMKIKFSTCTALYKPARPSYEQFKRNGRDGAVITEVQRASSTLTREYQGLKGRNRRNSTML